MKRSENSLAVFQEVYFSACSVGSCIALCWRRLLHNTIKNPGNNPLKSNKGNKNSVKGQSFLCRPRVCVSQLGVG